MLFVEAQHFTNASRGPGDIERIIVHTAEIGETRKSAESIANFFKNIPASAPPSQRVSAHYTVDNDSVVQCVKDQDIAYHAMGDNEQSLGYELSGFAGQSFAQWRDDYSRKVIDKAAVQMAADCKAYSIPVRWLTNAQLKARERGFATHKQVSDLFGQGIRSDPGAQFPDDLLLRRIQFHMGELSRVVYYISDEANTKALATSAPVNVNDAKARRKRIDDFTSNQVALLDKETNEDRDVVLRRRKA
jgi:hypothetical protein